MKKISVKDLARKEIQNLKLLIFFHLNLTVLNMTEYQYQSSWEADAKFKGWIGKFIGVNGKQDFSKAL